LTHEVICAHYKSGCGSLQMYHLVVCLAPIENFCVHSHAHARARTCHTPTHIRMPPPPPSPKHTHTPTHSHPHPHTHLLVWTIIVVIHRPSLTAHPLRSNAECWTCCVAWWPRALLVDSRRRCRRGWLTPCSIVSVMQTLVFAISQQAFLLVSIQHCRYVRHSTRA
jgi:hypothetical protein